MNSEIISQVLVVVECKEYFQVIILEPRLTSGLRQQHRMVRVHEGHSVEEVLSSLSTVSPWLLATAMHQCII